MKPGVYADHLAVQMTAEWLKISIKVIVSDGNEVFYVPDALRHYKPIILYMTRITIDQTDSGHYDVASKIVDLPQDDSVAKLAATYDKYNVSEYVHIYEIKQFCTTDREITPGSQIFGATAEENCSSPQEIRAQNEEYINEIYSSIVQDGIKEPIICAFDKTTGRCAVADGNYSVVAAWKLGLLWIPIEINLHAVSIAHATCALCYDEDSADFCYFALMPGIQFISNRSERSNVCHHIHCQITENSSGEACSNENK